MDIKPAEIVGIPFPYTDMSTQKRRPVLVLTQLDQRGDFIGLAVTSVPTKNLALCITEESLKSGKLPKTSWVRYDKIFTLSSDLVRNKYAALQDKMFNRIMVNLCCYLGCDRYTF